MPASSCHCSEPWAAPFLYDESVCCVFRLPRLARHGEAQRCPVGMADARLYATHHFSAWLATHSMRCGRACPAGDAACATRGAATRSLSDTAVVSNRQRLVATYAVAVTRGLRHASTASRTQRVGISIMPLLSPLGSGDCCNSQLLIATVRTCPLRLLVPPAAAAIAPSFAACGERRIDRANQGL